MPEDGSVGVGMLRGGWTAEVKITKNRKNNFFKILFILFQIFTEEVAFANGPTSSTIVHIGTHFLITVINSGKLDGKDLVPTKQIGHHEVL